MVVDSKSHYIYLPAALCNQPKESGLDGSKQRPVMVNGSFEVLVVGK
jgi:hypothetical protein